MSRWAAAGAILWLALVAGRLTGLTRLTLIDLLFLLAPLVIAPLGLRLIAFATSPGSGLLAAAVRSQPVGAASATVAFLLPIGVAAAIFDGVDELEIGDDPREERPFGPSRAAKKKRRGRQVVNTLHADFRFHGLNARNPNAGGFVIALGFLAFGAVWLVLSRAGVAPLGLSPIVVELTAVHFHFTGFAATLMAALVLTSLHHERGISRQIALGASLLMVAGSPVVAAGWGTPFHVLQVVGAFLLAAGVIATAAVVFFRSTSLVESTPARTLLRLSALAPLVPMVLAVEYSAGHIFGFPTLDIHAMALIHGDLNALGFSSSALRTFMRRRISSVVKC